MNLEYYKPLMNAQRSGYSYPGFADYYDAYRPTPPNVLPDILLQLAQTSMPELVVDLGSGTGLSSFIWAGRACHILGIEPLDSMRLIAERKNRSPNVRFQDGVAQLTGLPDNSVDIVTCAQSLHWMEPDSTLEEITRILRPGGVFEAYDHDRIPTAHWEIEYAFDHCMVQRREWWRKVQGENWKTQLWSKDNHLLHLRRDDRFRYIKEFMLHHIEQWTVEHWIGYALSCMPGIPIGSVESVDAGLEELCTVARKILGNGGLPVYFTYRVRVGVS